MIFANVGIKGDLVALIAGAVRDFKYAAGANRVMDRRAHRAAIRGDGLQHHRRIADRHKLRAFEQMHQGQRPLGLARGHGAAGCRGGSRRDQRHLIPDLEYLLNLQRRNAPEARGPLVKSVEARPEVTKDAFDVRRPGIHGGQDEAGDGRNQEAAPLTGAWVEKCISGPSRWLVRRETLERLAGERSRRYSPR